MADQHEVEGVLRSGDAGRVFEVGVALCNAGQVAEAIGAFEKVVELRPGDRVAWNNLGMLLANQGKMEEGLACLRRGAEGPTLSEHVVNLAAMLMHVGKLKEAGEKFARVVEAEPGNRFAWKQLGVIRQEQGRVMEGVDCFRRACAGGADPAYQSNLVYASLFHPGMSAEEVFAEHLAWDRAHGVPRHRTTPHRNDRRPGRKLRVGYLGVNFHDHAVMVFLEPVMAHHDHSSFEIVCYSASEVEDETTRRLRGYADGWRSILGMNDQQAAELIEGDEVDVLVDMAEHMSGFCAAIIARQPAPVQLTWCYPYSSGQSAMGFRVTDEYADPMGMTEGFNSERLIRMKGSYYCYLPPGGSPEVNEAPCVGNGYVTFGSMNQMSKVSERVVRVWGEIMKQAPGSRLALFGPGGVEENGHVLEWFRSNGVDASRIELLPRAPRRHFLEYFHRIDVALDPFPFAGHTTSCECLWMGVSLVTLAGMTAQERMGVSVLENVGRGEWVASDEEEYVRKGVELARDTARLVSERKELRGEIRGSRLMDYVSVTRDLEGAYRRAWRGRCESVVP